MSHHHHDPGYYIHREAHINWCDADHADHHHHGDDGSTIYHDHGLPDNDDYQPRPDHQHRGAIYHGQAPLQYEFGPADHEHDA